MSTKTGSGFAPSAHVKNPFPKQTGASTDHAVGRSEINISGNKVLLALTIAFVLTTGLIWAFVRYWLFAP